MRRILRLVSLRRLRDITAADRRDHLRWAVRVRWLAIGGFSALALLAWQLGVLADLRAPAATGTAGGGGQRPEPLVRPPRLGAAPGDHPGPRPPMSP